MISELSDSLNAGSLRPFRRRYEKVRSELTLDHGFGNRRMPGGTDRLFKQAINRRRGTPRKSNVMNNTARWRDKIRLTAPIGWATAVLLFGLLLTVAWTSNRHSELQKQAEALFQLQADILAAEIERRVLLPQYGLRGGAGAIAFAGSIDRLAFRRYVQSRNLDTEFPGVQGFGFIERVARTDLQSFVQRERLDAAPDFSVRSSGVV